MSVGVPGSRLEPKLVLVVDDDPGIQALLELALESEGYRVLIARDGIEALERLDEGIPHVVILDLMMPRLDGPGFIQEVQRRGLREKLNILVLTAASRGRDNAKQLGVESYLDKPFSMPDFLSEVGRLAA